MILMPAFARIHWRPLKEMNRGNRSNIIKFKHIGVFALYGSKEVLVAYKMLPWGVGTSSTPELDISENPFIYIYIYIYCFCFQTFKI